MKSKTAKSIIIVEAILHIKMKGMNRQSKLYFQLFFLVLNVIVADAI